jgi:hypothetical protein
MNEISTLASDSIIPFQLRRLVKLTNRERIKIANQVASKD